MAIATRGGNAFLDRIANFIGGARPASASQGDQLTGMFRMGNLGSFSGQAWYYGRIVSAVYHNPTGKRCTDAIASAFARAPLTCYAPGDKNHETPVESPLQAILNQPVPQGLSVQPVSGKALARKRARDLTLAGMHLNLKIRGSADSPSLTDGPVSQLRRLPPQRVTVVGNEHDELMGFIYTDRLGGRLPLLPHWCVYDHFSHPDYDYRPFPPALAAGLGAEGDNRAARFNLDLLENDGAIPAVVMLEGLTPGQFGEWVAAWQETEDPGKVRFMGFKGTPSGGKSVEVIKVGQTNEELQHTKIRDYSREDVRKALGCPPVVAFDLAHETYANAETEINLWYATTIWDYWDQSGDEQTSQLGYEFGVELAYDTSRIAELQESRDSLVNRQMTLQNNKNVTINATNAKLGLPSVPWGDEPQGPTLPMQPAPIGPADPEEEPAPEPPPKPPTPKSAPTPEPPKAALPAYRRLARAALEIAPVQPPETVAPPATAREVAQAVERATRRMQRFLDRQGRAIVKRVSPAGNARSASAVARRGYFDALRWDDELAEDAQALVDDLDETGTAAVGAREMAQRVNEETRAQLEAVVNEAVAAGRSLAEISEAVKAYFAERGQSAAEIVRAELERLTGETAEGEVK